MKAGKTGVSTDTPKSIMFGAGTIHKGLAYDSTAETWNFEASCIGATQGGSKITITPEFVDVEADGALVLVKGLKVKTGETASMEINLLELTKQVAPHVGAWIEILMTSNINSGNCSRAPCGRVD